MVPVQLGNMCVDTYITAVWRNNGIHTYNVVKYIRNMLQKCSGMKQVDSVIAGVMSMENQICKVSSEIDVLVMDHTY